MPVQSSFRPCLAPVLTGFLLASTGLAAQPAPDQPILNQVVMATSGMGWLGFSARTDATGQIMLDLQADQLDDALKSLTVTATAPNSALTLKQVTIGGQGALADPFQNTPLQPEDLTSLTRLFDRLRGSTVEIIDDFEDDDSILGQVVGVENRQSGEDGVVVERPYLMLSTVDGLVAIDLNEADAIRLEDPVAQGALESVLDRSAQARSDERRVLDIVTDAEPDAPVRLGLLVQTPVWKPTWRLILADGGARIQGWAVVENQTGQDWQDVRLTLVDGDATTLRQDLATSWFVDRPTVPVIEEPAPQPLAVNRRVRAKASAAPERAEMAGLDAGFAPAPVEEAVGGESELATTFSIKAPVDVADKGSLMVPLLDKSLQAERIAFVPAGGAGGAPEAAIRLDNDTGTSLPRGIVTVMESGSDAAPVHVGDAVLPPVPAGAERRLSFGADRKIRYAITQDDSSAMRALTVAEGIVTLRITQRQERRWRFESEDTQPRRVEVQAWAEPGAEPVAPVDPRQQGGFWYLDGQLPAGGETELSLVTERLVEERFALTETETLDTILAARGLSVPDAWKPKIIEISNLAARRAAAEQTLARLAEERAAIVAEQDRIRANLESVAEAGPLRERWLAELARQEDRLASLGKDRQAAVQERDDAATALRALVAELGR